MTKLLVIKSKFCRSEKCDEDFKEIKNMLVTDPVLMMPDYNKPIMLYVDASQCSVGDVLMQDHGGGRRLIILMDIIQINCCPSSAHIEP